MRRKKGKWRLLGLALLLGAVITELRKAPDEREGHGRVGGIVPYDFRTPTLDRFRAAVWNPDDERLFPPTVFGVGWGVNFAQVAELVKASRAEA